MSRSLGAATTEYDVELRKARTVPPPGFKSGERISAPDKNVITFAIGVTSREKNQEVGKKEKEKGPGPKEKRRRGTRKGGGGGGGPKFGRGDEYGKQDEKKGNEPLP